MLYVIRLFFAQRYFKKNYLKRCKRMGICEGCPSYIFRGKNRNKCDIKISVAKKYNIRMEDL